MAERLSKAQAYEIAAEWHDTQALRFTEMSHDEPRIDAPTRALAGQAARHHSGSAAALRLAGFNLRRQALRSSDGGKDHD